MSTKKLRLSSQPLEQDIVVLSLHCLGQQVYTFRDGKCSPSGIFKAPDGSLFWRANAGAKVVQSKGQQYLFKANPAGTADILAILAPTGRAAGLECKRPGERQNEVQLWWQDIASRAGLLYAVFHSPNEAREIVARWHALPTP